VEDLAHPSLGCKIGDCYSFNDDENSRIMYPHEVPMKQFSLSMWVNFAALGSEYHGLAGWGDYDGTMPYHELSIAYKDDAYKFHSHDRPEDVDYIIFKNDDTVLSEGEWYHFVWVHKDYDETILYINGNPESEVAEIVGSPELVDDSLPFYLGQRGVYPDHGWDSLNGELDEVGLWERALSQDEVLQLYNDGEGYYPIIVVTNDFTEGMEVYYSFDNDEDDDFRGRDATIVGDPTHFSDGGVLGGYYDLQESAVDTGFTLI